MRKFIGGDNIGLVLAIGALLMLGSASAAIAEVAVITSPQTSINRLDAEQVKNIYLGKAEKLPDGSAVELVDLGENDQTRDEFYSKVANKNASQIKAYWAKRIFTGKGSPPQAMPDDAAVKKWVTGAPGRVGYIDSGSVDASVKVLLKLP